MVKTRGATDNNKHTHRKATPDELATNAPKRNKAGSTKSIANVFAGSSNQDNEDVADESSKIDTNNTAVLMDTNTLCLMILCTWICVD